MSRTVVNARGRGPALWGALRLGPLCFLLTTGACVTGVVDEGGSTKCADPLKGSRYSVCGHLSSTGFDTTPVNGTRVVGSVDSTHGQTSSRYSLKGGTFHAYR